MSGLPATRVAGRTVAGLRLRPAQPASTVGHVDVWADPSSGLPVRVAVFGRGGPAVMDARFLDLDTAAPSPARTAFAPPAGARLVTQDPLDLAGLIDRFGGVRPPDRLAGLARNTAGPAVGMVGTYGRGVTEMSVAAVPGRDAGGLRSELAKAPGATTGKDGSVALGVGPLQLLLGPPGRRDAAWLLVGTVTAPTLTTALDQLPAPVGFRR